MLCAISSKLMSEPVRSPHGHAFERKAIKSWISMNGSICPLTGQPLALSELSPDAALKARITAYHVQRRMEQMGLEAAPTADGDDADEALYDFA